jgi:hypothetical protein
VSLIWLSIQTAITDSAIETQNAASRALGTQRRH